MKSFCLLVTAVFGLSVTGCDKSGERVLVEETRRKTTKDIDPKMFATSDERFRDTQPSPVQGSAPENWLALPASQFRLLNYRFGESGLGEVYVSLSSGSVIDNVNRWLKQFGRDAMSAADFSGMERMPVAGSEGVWVEATGEYGSGMGADAKPGYGLAGVVAEADGKILTVKMLGPENEVKSERQRLRDYIGTLRVTGN